jgi:hypothetical protein
MIRHRNRGSRLITNWPSLLALVVVLNFPSPLLTDPNASAQSAATSSAGSAPAASVNPSRSPPSQSAIVDEWRRTMSRSLPSKNGCFTITHPDTNWREVPCFTSKAPPRPFPLARGRAIVGVGFGNDFSAGLSNVISIATGSFDSVSGVSKETSAITGLPNTYSLQLNTNNYFHASACGNASNGNCAWEQFIFSTSACDGAPCVYIQYWLLGLSEPCPKVTPYTGWYYYAGNENTEKGCYGNSMEVLVPGPPLAGLGKETLTASAGQSAGGSDQALFFDGTNPALYASQNDSILNLSQTWSTVEFNIFGDGTLQGVPDQATFNDGSTIVVRTSVDHGDLTAPSCVFGGFTAETNNLSLVVPSTSTLTLGSSAPSIVFTESKSSNANPMCSSVRNANNGSLAQTVSAIISYLLR